ncbi:nuclear transport factor 2 family protein [Sphingomonas sp. YL-JM2C]
MFVHGYYLPRFFLHQRGGAFKARGPDIGAQLVFQMRISTLPGDRVHPDAMNENQQVADLVIGFFRALDERDDRAAGDAFAPDGIWHRQGAALTGPEGIAEVLAARPADRRSVHVVTNMAISPTSSGFVARYYLTGYVASGDAPLAPSAILDCRDEIEARDGRLRIRLKTSKLLGHFH